MKTCVSRLLVFTMILLSPLMAFAGPRYGILYYFPCSLTLSCPDGLGPEGVIRDASGNLYGTTTFGGANLGSGQGAGTVFNLAPPAQSGGPWTETVLYNFCSAALCIDGQNPEAGLIQDAAGNLYGTTYGGGAHDYGTVFELAPPSQSGGPWTQTVLYSFCSAAHCADGELPEAGLIQDAAGNLYGTTTIGGVNNQGTVFKLAPPAQSGGPWTEAVLYSFCSVASCTDGAQPFAGLLQDAVGNLYGTTLTGGAGQGGSGSGGTVFELAPPAQSGGPWTETVLYSFCSVAACTDGELPEAGLIQDVAGNFYGTTNTGGAGIGYGTVFKLAPPPQSGGAWAETVLYTFCSGVAGTCYDAYAPSVGLIYASGRLYGSAGGGLNSSGTVFVLVPPTKPGGPWTETLLYNFCTDGGCYDGAGPSGLIQDAAGNLYGTAGGGPDGGGVVFEIAGGVYKAYPALGEQVDFFGEGRADFTVWRPSNGTFYSTDGSGNQKAKAWGVSTDNPVIGDYDGDGKTDVAVFRPSIGSWLITYSSNGKVVTKGWGTYGDIEVPGDYDGDGKTDYAVWRPSDGNWYIIQSSNGQEVTRGWGEEGDIPVPGDYDGDGKTDFAVWRPSNATFYIIQSSNGQEVTRAFGEEGDIPVPGDYDGDGKTDYAVFRPSVGTWFIIYSSNGEIVTKAWGTKGDVPVARDYDGDGKTDYAVWRPSDGTWFVIYSTSGETLRKAWGISTDIPMNKPVGQ